MKKETIKDKFKRNLNFVKPLYKKAKVCDRDKNKSVSFDRTLKLLGDDIDVRTVLAKSDKSNVINIKQKVSKEYNIVLPGACDSEIKFDHATRDSTFRPKVAIDRNIVGRESKPMFSLKNSAGSKRLMSDSKLDGSTSNVEARTIKMGPSQKTVILHKMPDTWLRVYPAPKVAGEPIYSVIIRCVVCQLGLTTFLVLWTIIGVFIIQSFEGPQEEKVAKDFNKEQNQLVIDLATELRQITPLSPKWKQAIEKRIEEERRLTMLAVTRGARLNPGQFWDLPGTFLFAVYVMTALGFGAPVPYTVWGRTSALIYAILAVPTHIYLMVNASTCLVVNVDEYTQHLKTKLDDKTPTVKSNFESTDNPSHSRDSEFLKNSDEWKIRKSLRSILSVFCFGRCVPLATLVYYLLGVVAFGVLREKTPLDTIMFPLEFTTTGGLERVESHVRILYGLYVEGAMCLLACALATLKRQSSCAVAGLAHSYRLFNAEKCDQCPGDTDRGKI